ncbi:carbohydrate ABC transporter permease [Arthrobacter pigmenti]
MAVNSQTRETRPLDTRGPAETPPGNRRSFGVGHSPKMALFAVPAIIFLAILSIWPLFKLLRMSVSEVRPSNLIGGWDWTGFSNYVEAFQSAQLWESAWATLLFTIALLAANLIIGFLAANLLARAWKSDMVIQSLMIFVWALPPVVIGNIWRFLFNENGLVNAALGLVGIESVNWLGSPESAIWTVAFVASWASIPFAVMLIRAALLSVPQEVIEAAAIDGAGPWRIRLQINLPLIRPTLTILAILTVMYGFRSFDFVYVLTKGGPGTSSATLPYLAYREAFTKLDFSQGATVATIAMIFVVIVALAYARASRRELQL